MKMKKPATIREWLSEATTKLGAQSEAVEELKRMAVEYGADTPVLADYDTFFSALSAIHYAVVYKDVKSMKLDQFV